MNTTHLKTVTSDDLGELTLLVGDPARVTLISQNWEQTRVVSQNRELTLVSGLWKGKRVSICSTGMGVGSTEIAVIELIQSGAKQFVRLGGCGAWSNDIQAGDLMFNHGMVRDKGMLASYVPDTYPATADPVLLGKLTAKAREDGFTSHVGLGMTTQSYYLGQGRDPQLSNGPKGDPAFMSFWQERHVLNCDMETAVLYLLASLYQIPAANCLVVHLSRMNQEKIEDTDYEILHQNAAELVLTACLT
ncbi:nucleoside phosphorylase [Carnobacterium divergens]|uniref:Uridine phosphorylase n=1 Tax=Carnobacterium divergens TaxID=2748 RepID=A0A2R8A3M2_CARDV|nr:nucleoside phosphorylase [Carnobacterium divergens]MCO6016886.1 nucleoside phosphorylase [Carnobacterium divergens]TFI62571.1 uridine phosphorylase [Carnobacterium divergens]TFI72690.1 uridine phosphorylase [Carnobacterium divergens]TFI77129.1 uridine phosphorylase [Carnobacterium divergens]TFI83430.1 uridine phosphorylase [Carnobacterium divergens]